MKVHPYYSNTPEVPEVYHDDDQCPYGKAIKPENRMSGTDNRKKCSFCRG